MATLQRMFAAAASAAAPAYFLGTHLVYAQDATKATEAANAAQVAVPACDAKDPPSACPVHKASGKHAPEPPSSCPMHNSGGAPTDAASNDSSQRGAASRSSEGCPVMHGTREQRKEGDGSEVLNMDNMMPAPNQMPAPGQKVALSTDRVVSTIPRGGDAGTWMYPSEQMFYNALLRKGKGEGVQEKDMNAVVAIHNNMNERGWMQVLEWESLHCDECKAPKLLRFVGRPDDLSPKARLKVMFGLAPRPFDRHDWTIDRCGKEVNRWAWL
uniref:Holocytochrome c-type synthase n=1 Tax=Chrysotila carterae TaxID=13221 RepID=A0A7S4EZL5_CHRCT